MSKKNSHKQQNQFSPRVLLSAYQCGAGMGSVSQIGWEWYSRLSTKVPVTLITHIRNREILKKYNSPLNNSEIIFIDTEWFAAPLWKIANKLFPHSEHAVFLLSQIDFFIYDWLAKREVKRQIKNGKNWDIVHAVTPVSPSAPTSLHKTGLPLIVGPLNGGLESPKNFPELMKADSAWFYPIKKIGRIFDLFIGSARNAKKILTATVSTIAAFPKKYQAKCLPMLENGVDLNLFKPTEWQTIPDQNNALKILFVGRLIPAKAVSLLLEAVRRFSLEFPVELSIVGEGPMREEWQNLANELGLNQIAKFYGNLSLPEISEKMQDCHVFCLPSVRESGGAVLLEAMATARPVIAVDYGGPKEIVDSEVGEAIAPNGTEAVIFGLYDAFCSVLANPTKWQNRGKAGRKRAEKLFGWEAKIGSVIELYKKTLVESDPQFEKSAEVERWAIN
ncbi:MAG: glycosyltransferase family 4 protein [Pyrinomonadaceae bacterium]|nr:glycosyltransferase family 4 protein [Pyrinomonadaceae bacterium]